MKDNVRQCGRMGRAAQMSSRGCCGQQLSRDQQVAHTVYAQLSSKVNEGALLDVVRSLCNTDFLSTTQQRLRSGCEYATRFPVQGHMLPIRQEGHIAPKL